LELQEHQNYKGSRFLGPLPPENCS